MAKSVSHSPRTSARTRSGAVSRPGRIRKIAKRNVGMKSRPITTSSLHRIRSQHRVLWSLLPVGLVLVAITALVITKVAASSMAAPTASKVVSGSGAVTSSTGNTALPAGVLAKVTSVSASTLTAVGEPNSSVTPVPTGIKPPLTRNGKPEVLFVSAEYCPFCAAQRWPLVVALSQFGSFGGLSATHSSTTDVYPDTKSFSFYGSTYTSSSLNFTSVELQTNRISGDAYTTLQTLTAPEEAILSKFDGPPYTTEAGSIPFLDIANEYVSIGSGYSPQVLQGLSLNQIAQQLNDKDSPVAQAIDGEANRIVVAITEATGIQPNRADAVPTPTHS